MGLAIHYSLRAGSISAAEAGSLVERLRDAAGGLPFDEVGEIVELTGAACAPPDGGAGSLLDWLKIQAIHWVQCSADGERYDEVHPDHLIAFGVQPAEGCEGACFGLCLYPATVGGGQVPTGRSGWCWSSACKTQYASDPSLGGLDNFLRGHLGIIRLLDEAKELGILGEVTDEGGYWEKRDLPLLVKTIGEWNEMMAGFAGSLRDAAEASGGSREGIEAEIFRFPNFEHLEAKDRLERGDRC